MLSSRRATTAAIVALTLAAVTVPAPARAQAAPAWTKGLVEELDRYRAEWKVPGAAVVVVKDDKVVLATGLGVRELGKPSKVDADTLFGIASNTKAFTAALAVSLAREGQLSLDDRLVDLLPGFALSDPWTTRQATLRDALSHRLGYETWAGDVVAWGSSYDGREVIRRMRLLDPRENGFRTYGYNNWPFVAAALVLEARTGRPWAELVRERLLGPMGMTRTTTGVPDLEHDPDVATPHSLIHGAWRPIPHTVLGAYAPAAGIYSNANDLGRWLRTQLADGRLDGKVVLQPDVLAEMRQAQLARRLTPQFLANYPGTVLRATGLGLMLRASRGRLVVDHSGAVDGMFSEVVTVPSEKLGVAVVTNAETNFQEIATEVVLDRALGGAKETARAARSREWLARWVKEDGQDEDVAMLPARAAGARPPLPPERYAGRYLNDFLGDCVVKVVGGRLFLEMPWHPGLAATLEPLGNDVFRAPWRAPAFKVSPVAFAVGADGRATALRTRVLPFIDPLEYTFRRVGD